MSDEKIIQTFETLRGNLIHKDRRFSEKNGKLCFEGVDLEQLARKYHSPVYVFSEKEIYRNLAEISEAFKAAALKRTRSTKSRRPSKSASRAKTSCSTAS